MRLLGRVWTSWLLVALIAASVAACGGGSGGESPNEMPPPPEDDDPGGGDMPPGEEEPPPPEEEEPTGDFQTAEFEGSKGLDNINALPAFEAGGSGEGVTVGVVDTGVDPDHPDLENNVSSASTDVVRDAPIEDGDTVADNAIGHGTVVSGLIAAEKNDRVMHGVAFESRILAARADIGDSCEEECKFSDFSIAQGIQHALDFDAPVVNISLGGEAFGPAVQTAARDAAQEDTLLVIAAGNQGEVDPGGFAQIADDGVAGDHIIVVGATDQNDRIADFSNRAGNLQDSFLVAPGAGLDGPAPQELCGEGSGFCTVMGAAGTSFAAPHVSGAVAVLAQLFPSLSGPEMRQILFESATDLGEPGVDADFGHGLLNLGEAVEPMGETTAPTTAEGESGEPTPDSGMASSAAFGDALLGTALFEDIVVTDRFDRSFRADLSPSFTGAAKRLGVRRFARHRPTTLRGAERLGSAGRLRFRAREDRYAAVSASLPAYRRARIEPPEPYLHLSGRLDARTDFAVAQGHSPARLLDRRAGAAPAGLFATGDRIDTPFLAFSERAQTLRVGRRLGGDLRLEVAFAHAGSEGREQARLASLARARRKSNLVTQLTGSLGPLHWRSQLGLQMEDGSVLGTRSSGAVSLARGARSTFLGIDAVLPLGSGWRLFGRHVAGWTEPTGAGSGLIDSLSSLKSRAFSAGLRGRGVLREGDRLALALAQPLRVTGGAVTARVPVERDFDAERFLFETRRRALSPSGRELDLELAYRLRPARGVRLETNLVQQFEAGHIDGGQSIFSALVRLRIDF